MHACHAMRSRPSMHAPYASWCIQAWEMCGRVEDPTNAPHLSSSAPPCMPASIASLRLVFSLFFFRSHLNRSLMVAGILCGHPAFRSAPLAGQPAPFARRWAGSWVPPCLAGAFRFLRPIQDADPVIRLELAAGTLFPPGRDLWSAFLTR